MPDTPEDLVDQLIEACRKAGLAARELGQRRVWVNQRDGSPRMAETLTLLPTDSGEEFWHYSWGAPMCKGTEAERAAVMIGKVTALVV